MIGRRIAFLCCLGALAMGVEGTRRNLRGEEQVALAAADEISLNKYGAPDNEMRFASGELGAYAGTGGAEEAEAETPAAKPKEKKTVEAPTEAEAPKEEAEVPKTTEKKTEPEEKAEKKKVKKEKEEVADKEAGEEKKEKEDEKEDDKEEKKEKKKEEEEEKKAKEDDEEAKEEEKPKPAEPEPEPEPEEKHTGPAITQKSCVGMLRDVEARKPPYFVNGKFTKETRSDVIKQCGQLVCEWAKKHDELGNCPNKKLGGCPQDCSKPQEGPKSFLGGWEKVKDMIPMIEKALEGHDVKNMKVLLVTGDKAKVVDMSGMNAKKAPVPAPAPVDDNLGPPSEPNLPLPGGQEPQVTRGFCDDVLKKVKAREAPYFVEGRFTGDCRTSLIQQCGMYVCDWAQKYKSAADTCQGKDTSAACGACKSPAAYIASLFASQSLGTFANTVVVSSNGGGPITSIPAGPPLVHAAAPAPAKSSGEESKDAAEVKVQKQPSPNDPRDPDFNDEKWRAPHGQSSEMINSSL